MAGGGRRLAGWLTHPGFAAAVLLVVVAATGLHVANLGKTPSRFERVMAPPAGGSGAREARSADRRPLEGALKGHATDGPAGRPAAATGAAPVSAVGDEAPEVGSGESGSTTTANTNKHTNTHKNVAVGELGLLDLPAPPARGAAGAPARNAQDSTTKSLRRGLGKAPARLGSAGGGEGAVLGGSQGERSRAATGRPPSGTKGAERGPVSSRRKARRPKAGRTTRGGAGLGTSASGDQAGAGTGVGVSGGGGSAARPAKRPVEYRPRPADRPAARQAARPAWRPVGGAATGSPLPKEREKASVTLDLARSPDD